MIKTFIILVQYLFFKLFIKFDIDLRFFLFDIFQIKALNLIFDLYSNTIYSNNFKSHSKPNSLNIDVLF